MTGKPNRHVGGQTNMQSCPVLPHCPIPSIVISIMHSVQGCVSAGISSSSSTHSETCVVVFNNSCPEMNGRHDELTRRRDRRASTLSRRNSQRTQTSDDDSEFSRCPSPLLTVDSGYRVDPFTPYPVTQASRGVRYMADYCEFSLHKAKKTLMLDCRYTNLGASASFSV